jgi:hypothetical protein
MEANCDGNGQDTQIASTRPIKSFVCCRIERTLSGCEQQFVWDLLECVIDLVF